jgi:hypothetical protein
MIQALVVDTDDGLIASYRNGSQCAVGKEIHRKGSQCTVGKEIHRKSSQCTVGKEIHRKDAKSAKKAAMPAHHLCRISSFV